jgi:hypothetical protein
MNESRQASAVTADPRVFPMTFEQEAMWLDDFVNDGESRHLEAWAVRLAGRLDVGALEWAISQIVARHEVLRSRLTEIDEKPVQIVTDPGPVRLAQVSCSAATLTAELSRIGTEPLDLDERPLRPWLVRLPGDEFILMVQFHHAVIDDWSLDIFQRELMHFYTARLAGRAGALEPLPMQVGEFAVAQRAAGVGEADLAYWRERVLDRPVSCTIPPDREGSDGPAHRAGWHWFGLDPELGRAVRAVGRALRTSSFTIFAGTTAVLLWAYGKADDVIFGTPVSSRGSAALDGMMGCFTNVHPLRLAVSPDMTFRTLAGAARAEVLGAIEHSVVPYSTIVRMSRLGSTLFGPPLCDVVIVVDDMGWEQFSLPGVSIEPVHPPAARAKFSLHFTLSADADGGFAGLLRYDAEIFDAATAARVADRFTELLAHCIAAPDEPLGGIPGSAPTLRQTDGARHDDLRNRV